MTRKRSERSAAYQKAHDDRDWWQEAGNVLGLRLHGWSDRHSASFFDPQGRLIELNEYVGKGLHEIKAKFAEEIDNATR